MTRKKPCDREKKDLENDAEKLLMHRYKLAPFTVTVEEMELLLVSRGIRDAARRMEEVCPNKLVHSYDLYICNDTYKVNITYPREKSFVVPEQYLHYSRQIPLEEERRRSEPEIWRKFDTWLDERGKLTMEHDFIMCHVSKFLRAATTGNQIIKYWPAVPALLRGNKFAKDSLEAMDVGVRTVEPSCSDLTFKVLKASVPLFTQASVLRDAPKIEETATVCSLLKLKYE